MLLDDLLIRRFEHFELSLLGFLHGCKRLHFGRQAVRAAAPIVHPGRNSLKFAIRQFDRAVCFLHGGLKIRNVRSKPQCCIDIFPRHVLSPPLEPIVPGRNKDSSLRVLLRLFFRCCFARMAVYPAHQAENLTRTLPAHDERR